MRTLPIVDIVVGGFLVVATVVATDSVGAKGPKVKIRIESLAILLPIFIHSSKIEEGLFVLEGIHDETVINLALELVTGVRVKLGHVDLAVILDAVFIERLVKRHRAAVGTIARGEFAIIRLIFLQVVLEELDLHRALLNPGVQHSPSPDSDGHPHQNDDDGHHGENFHEGESTFSRPQRPLGDFHNF